MGWAVVTSPRGKNIVSGGSCSGAGLAVWGHAVGEMVKGVGGSESSARRNMSPCMPFQPLCPQSPRAAPSDHRTLSVLQMLYMLYSLSCRRTSAQSCLIPCIWMLPPLLHGNTIIPSLAQLPQASPDDPRPTQAHQSKLFSSTVECPTRVDQQTVMLSAPKDSQLQDSETVGFCFFSGFFVCVCFLIIDISYRLVETLGCYRFPSGIFQAKGQVNGWMDGWMKGRGRQPREKKRSGMLSQAERLAWPQYRSRKAVWEHGPASWCFQCGEGGARWELGRGGAHRTLWRACTSLQEGRPVQLCSKVAAPKSPHPRLKAGPRSLMLWPDVSPQHHPASLLSISPFEPINISHHCHAKSKYIIR